MSKRIDINHFFFLFVAKFDGWTALKKNFDDLTKDFFPLMKAQKQEIKVPPNAKIMMNALFAKKKLKEKFFFLSEEPLEGFEY